MERMFDENKLNGFRIFLKNSLKNNLDVKHNYIKISDFKVEKIFNKINDYKNIDILNIVVNFVDILGHSNQNQILSELIQMRMHTENQYLIGLKTLVVRFYFNIQEWDNTEIVITSDHEYKY